MTIEDVKKITDQELLFDIIEKDKNPYVREAAIMKLTDRNRLVEIINGGDKYVREWYEEVGVEDADYMTCVHETIFIDHRKTARERLDELQRK